ncbi:MAG: peptide-methionine (S)-S-oxide reductase, partial [Jiangellaceae bacterium]
MFLFDRAAKSRLVSADQALPGRDARPFALAGTHTVLGTPIDVPAPTGYEEVVVGMGCFWGAERIFWKLPGVWTTAVGYAGGHTPNPTYEEVCSGRTGHT